jgi:hypothetical protein
MPVVNGLTVTLGDLVEETTQTTGAGSYSLDGAPSGRRTFSQGIGSGTRTIYKAETASLLPYEVGIGTVTAGAPSTISRDAILLSSNNNLAVSWGPGSKRIFCDISSALANQIWARPSGSLPMGAVETRGPFTFSGAQSQIEFLAIASTARMIHLGFSNIARGEGTPLILQLGDSGGYEATGYVGATHWGTAVGRGHEVATTAWILASTGAGGNTHFGSVTLTNIGTSPGFWTYSGSCWTGGQNYSDHSAGAKALSGTFDRFRFLNGAAANFGAGGTVTAQIIHGV